MLLVDHRHAEAPKLHVVLNDGVRAHQDVDRPIGQSFEHLLAAFALQDSGQFVQDRYGRLELCVRILGDALDDVLGLFVGETEI